MAAFLSPKKPETAGGNQAILGHITGAMKEAASVLERKLVPGHGPTPSASSHSDSLSGLIARLRSWLEIPFGYENESGFHYGHEPVSARRLPWSSAASKILTDRACDAMLSPSPVPLSETDFAEEQSEAHRQIV